ncbi:uncharacterized ferritin-like protein (DUF455 family) [Thiogranum longum]|uniref:Uncharacterized ferritin-like protein (DUF455 family) n=2 Tax=Thiogranum longum TaxID=1537524 RepID=A0A4V6NDB0_9GAMM|nr:ferritin-like domain-containing protein [Thiogranum longum]TCK17786.1 uncharacterized ferritin-like protein (DUF455 family) [Thiogranum longum]
MMQNLFDQAKRCLDCSDPVEKLALTAQTFTALLAGDLSLESCHAPLPFSDAGRPRRPRLVAPRALPRRSPASREGRIALLHAIAHIEFNAINLAWDAVYRFRGLPDRYYHDWSRVAAEEAYHFRLLAARLAELGSSYGDMDAHDGLWATAARTAHDPLVRMALVPRVLEARGLDVTPGMIERLDKVGDNATVGLLEIILRDEIGHVEIGTRWFRHLCAQRRLDSGQTFQRLLSEYMQGQVRPPFHYEARRRAGFSDSEMRHLEVMAKKDGK